MFRVPSYSCLAFVYSLFSLHLDPLDQMKFRRKQLDETLVHIRNNFLKRRSLISAQNIRTEDGKVHESCKHLPCCISACGIDFISLTSYNYRTNKFEYYCLFYMLCLSSYSWGHRCYYVVAVAYLSFSYYHCLVQW